MTLLLKKLATRGGGDGARARMLDGASSDDATLVPSDDEDDPDPGPGQRVKGARYRTQKGDVRKWNGRKLVHDGPARQSRHDGVKWDRAKRKWIGSALDATERARAARLAARRGARTRSLAPSSRRRACRARPR